MGLRNEWVSDITIKQNVSFYIIATHKATAQCLHTHTHTAASNTHACSFDSAVKDTRNCNKLHGCDLKIELLLSVAQFVIRLWCCCYCYCTSRMYAWVSIRILYMLPSCTKLSSHCISKRLFKLPCWSPVKIL